MLTSDSPLPSGHPLIDGRTSDAPLVRAFGGERRGTPPVWFMRQAGRSLPEYRASRAGVAMLDACLEPELASEITLQPVRRHGVDAAVFFSDIVIPLVLADVDVEIVPGRGPVFAEPVRDEAALERLLTHRLEPEALAPIREAVTTTVDALGSTPLIGFAGAPFTLASYVIEGGPSKDHLRARALMATEPVLWGRLADWLADISSAFLVAQVDAGASAVQLFDSWAGVLSLEHYLASAAPASSRTLEAVGALGVRRSHFGVGTGELLAAMRDVAGGVDVVGVDHRITLAEASRRLGGATPVQGNIDPALLTAPWSALEAHVDDVVTSGLAAPAHILNLAHGVPPETDPTVLTRIVEHVHGADARDV